MRLAAEHPRIASAAAVGLLVLVLSAGVIARATAARTATVPPGVRIRLAQLERQNAQLKSVVQREARQLAGQRGQVLNLSAQVGAARAELGRARPKRAGGRRG